MPANPFQRFIDVPKTWQAQVSTANSNRDGATGTYATVVTAGANGSRINLIRFQASVTTTAGMWRLFLYDGTNARLHKEIPVSAISVSGTLGGYSAEYSPTQPIDLPSGWSLKASTENAEAATVSASGGDF